MEKQFEQIIRLIDETVLKAATLPETGRFRLFRLRGGRWHLIGDAGSEAAIAAIIQHQHNKAQIEDHKKVISMLTKGGLDEIDNILRDIYDRVCDSLE